MAAAVAVAVAVVVPGLWRVSGPPMEEGFMLVYPERLLAGDLPNADFVHIYGPVSIQVLAGWYAVVGESLSAERVFGIAQHLALVAALVVLARPWGRLAAGGVGLVAVVLAVTPIGATALAWNGGLALALWAVVTGLRARAVGDPARAGRWWFATGAFAGLALGYRPDLVLAIGLAVGWLAWRRADWRRLAVGGAVGLVPVAVHVALVGLGPAWDGMVVDPVVRLRGGRDLPRPPSWDRLDGFLQRVAELDPPMWPLPSPSPSQSLFLWFFLLLAATAGVVVAGVVAVRRRGDDGPAAVLLAGALVGVGILPQALQRADSTHLAWVSVVVLPLVVLALVEHAPRSWLGSTRARTAAALGVVALVLVAVVAPFTLRPYLHLVRVGTGFEAAAPVVSRGDREFRVGSAEVAAELAPVVAELDRVATPGDRLLVAPSDMTRPVYVDTWLYHLFADLEPATRFLQLDPGVVDGERWSADLAGADWVLLTGFWDGWSEPNRSVDPIETDALAVLAQRFCPVLTSPAGQVELLQRCR
ncbi:MAG TPA: hypothetical protein VK866_04315 [Acidimicrobiales bacterium]|nr:hypothetical protein [Acidimicrobiales bacterium]